MQGQVTGGPREVLLKLWKSCACPSSLQGAQQSSPCSPPPLSDVVHREPALAGVLGRRPGVAHTVLHILPRRFNRTASSWHTRTVSCQTGPVSEHSKHSSVLQHLPEALPSEFHSSKASWHHSNSCSQFSQEEGKRDSYSRSLSLLSLSLSLLSPSHLILSSAFLRCKTDQLCHLL